MGNAEGALAGPDERVCVFAVAESEGGLRLDGTFAAALKKLGLRDRGLAELVFGSVPLTGDGRMFKVHLLRDVVVCSFLSSRSAALVAAFVCQASPLLTDALLCHWEQLAASATTLPQLERAARVVFRLCETAHVPGSLPEAAATPAAAWAVQSLLESPSVRVSASSGDCAVAQRVWAAISSVGLSSHSVSLVPPPPPECGQRVWLFVAARPAKSAARIAPSAARMTASSGKASAVRALHRALALRAQAVVEWEEAWRQLAGCCAADVVLFARQCAGEEGGAEGALLLRVALQQRERMGEDFAEAVGVAVDLMEAAE